MRKGLSYDDVLLEPRYSEVDSRSDVDLSTEILPGIELDIPIISAPMDSVTGPELAQELADCGGVGILHRFADWETRRQWIREIDGTVGASIGISEEDISIAVQFEEAGVDFICVDVAHGHLQKTLDFVEEIDSVLDVPLMVGNVATYAGAEELYYRGADCVKAGVGGGCFASGTRILMANGKYKNIEDVEEGDRVINKNGNPVSVNKSWKTGQKRVSQLETNKWHKTTYVTPDHEFWTGDMNTLSQSTIDSYGYAKSLNSPPKKKNKRKFVWKEIDDYDRDVALLPSEINFELSDSFEIDLKKRTGGNGLSAIQRDITDTLKNTYETGYIFGTYLGDGDLHILEDNSNQINWTFGPDEVDIAEKLKSCINMELSEPSPKIKKNENTTVVTMGYIPLTKILQNFGKRQNKHLPNRFLVDDKKYLQGIFDGLLDSDGYIDRKRLGFSNTSEGLIELYGVLCHILKDGFPNYNKRRKTTGNLEGTKIENLSQPYEVRYGNTTPKRITDNGHQIVKPLNYKKTDEVVDVYDIEVDCPTHSFIANNTIVHNSLCTTCEKTGIGVPQFTTVRSTEHTPPTIVADGGISKPGDAVKALMGGADAVMMGGELGKCLESPGDDVWGMASEKGKEQSGSEGYIEGERSSVSYGGVSVKDVIGEYEDGIRSGLSYLGGHTIGEARENASFIEITPATGRRNGSFID